MPAKRLSYHEVKEIKQAIYELEQDVEKATKKLAAGEADLKRFKETDAEYADKLEKNRLWAEGLELYLNSLAEEKAKLPEEDPQPVDEPVAEKQPKPEMKVGDWILAYHDDEKKMSACKLISIMGRGDNAVFQIRFRNHKGQNNQIYQRPAKECKPATKIAEKHAERKRLAEEELARTQNRPSYQIQAEPQLKREPSLASAGPERPAKIARKLGSVNKLEKSRSSWNDFQSKNKKKTKDSMFRTGEGVNARVGFVGSGRPMTADVARKRHVHQEIEEE